MTVSGISDRSSTMMSSVLQLRRQLDQLQSQFGSGKKSDTFAGLGVGRGLDVALRAQIADMDAYSSNQTMVNTRLSIMQSTLSRLVSIGTTTKTAAQASFATIDAKGQTTAQGRAVDSVGEILDLLNSQVGERYVFGGRITDSPPVATYNAIMDGDGTRAGLKTVINERRAADQGADGMGRLVTSSPTATSTALSEDAAGSPFGLKLGNATTSSTAITLNGPSGSPAQLNVSFGSTLPQAGDTVTLSFTLPDGTSDSVTLTATTANPPGANQFTIGASAADTNANFQTALTGAVKKVADTSLVGASAIAAGNNFFDNPPMRVASMPANGATSLVAGTSDNTVFWYQGDTSSNPRATASAQVDQSITVSYGAQANEQGIRNLLQNVAVLAATSVNPTGTNAAAQLKALSDRTASKLTAQNGVQKIEDISSELAGAQSLIAASKDRQTQSKTIAQNMLQNIEGVSNEELASQILALQTNLQASLQTTSMLYKTTLLNYL